MRYKRSPIELLLVCVVMVGALMLTLIPTTAHARDVKTTVSCPATITNGGALNLSLTLQNTSSDSVAIAKSAVAIHLGNLRITGPSVVPLSLNLLAGETVTIPNYLSTPFPRSSRGTFSSVGVAVIDGANKLISEGWCNIEVQ